MPRQRYVTKVAQSATATWRILCHVRHEVGPETFFNFFFFCRDENQNWSKLQRQKSYFNSFYCL